MKNIITTIIVFVFTTIFSFGQNLDSLQFFYINQYRIKNGKKPLIWSDKLAVESTEQANNMIKKDSCFHSYKGWYYENCVYNKRDGSLNDVTASTFVKNSVVIKQEVRTDLGVKSFKIFIKKYFNLSYEQVMEDPNLYFVVYEIFMFVADEYHKKNYLQNTKYGSTKIIIKDVVKFNNSLFGKELYPGTGPIYYRALVSNTFNTN